MARATKPSIKYHDLMAVLEVLPPGEYRVRLNCEGAQELLKRNKHNRTISDVQVLKWATEMEDGRWVYNGDTIRLSEFSARFGGIIILDGQHRLEGLALQPPTFFIDVLIVTGLPLPVQVTIDQGKGRNAAEQLKISDIDVTKSMAAALRYYIMWENGWLFTDTGFVRAHMTNSRIVEYAEKHPELIDTIREGNHYQNIPAIRSGLAMAAFTMFVTETGDLEKVKEFFQRLLDGVGLEPTSPLLHLRNRLVSIAGKRIHHRDRDLLGLLIETYNKWVSGIEVQRVQLPRGGGYTEKSFPVLDVE